MSENYGVKSDLTVFVPTRQRPDALLSFGGEFERLKTADTRVVFIIDSDDEFKDRYIAKNRGKYDIYVASPTRRGMVGALNAAYRHYYLEDRLGFAVGFMGDDHRPRTLGWDQTYLDTLRELGTGFVYGNDLFQGERMPTQVAFTTDIAKALGAMCDPSFDHLCVDVVWKDLGDAIGRIKYLPDVIVEHMHYLNKKSRRDKAYLAVNNPMIARHDGNAYDVYKQGQFHEDVKKLKRLVDGTI